MFKHTICTILFLTMAPLAASAEDLSEQAPIEVKVSLGTKGGHLKFSPARLNFKAGRLYKLVLDNPSSKKHYFSALQFAAAVWTRKVETAGAEIKGAIREIELKPGGRAEWFFVPVKAGSFGLRCTIAGHGEAGMVGTITVK